MVLLNIFPAEELIPSPSHKYLEYISREITKIHWSVRWKLLLVKCPSDLNKFLFPMIRNYYTELLSGYIDMPQVKDTDTYIVPAGLEGNQGIIGAMNLF